jgi:hypothetical protein
MNFEELQQTADAAMSEALTSVGFRRAGAGNWIRRRGYEINVVHLQEHSTEKSFCVNLGIHYTFLPKAGTEAPLDGDQIEIPDCELKLRLTDQASVKDQWWPIGTLSVEQVADLVCNRGLPIFDSYKLDGPIAAMDGKSIESGNPGLLASITKVRACLLLARMYECMGNRGKCIEAATIGVKLAGMAVGPKKALKDILKRLGQPAKQ